MSPGDAASTAAWIVVVTTIALSAAVARTGDVALNVSASERNVRVMRLDHRNGIARSS